MKKLSAMSMRFGLLLGGLLFLFTACQKEETLEVQPKATSTYEANFAESSKIMASALASLTSENQTWQTAIKERATKAENGDNVFLYAFGKDMNVNGQTLSEALASYSTQNNAFFSEKILNDFPLISIAYNVPVRFKDAPMSVEVNTVFFDFQDDDTYKADQDIPHYVNGAEKTALYGDFNKRNDAFFVIKNNERIVLVNQLSNTITNDPNFEKDYLSNNPLFKDFFYSPDALLGTYNGVEYRLNAEIGYTLAETLESMTPSDARCFRETWTHVRDGSTAVIYDNDREGLFGGGPEIRQRLNRVENNGSLTPFNSGRNYGGGNEGNELVFNYNAFLLNLNIHGDAYGWAWWEEDGGSGDDRFNGSFSATIPGIGTIGLNYDFAKNKDDNYGNMEVSRCMGAQWIDIGDIRWWGGPTHW